MATRDEYTESLALHSKQQKELQQRIYLIGTIRLAVVVVAAVLLYILGTSNWMATAICAGVVVAIYVGLMKYHDHLFEQRELIEARIGYYQRELQLLDYNFEKIEGGNSYIDATHDYTYDLDIFGEKSLYAYINRTNTPIGNKQLATLLQHPLQEAQQIEAQQEAVKELAQLTHLRQEFYAYGTLCQGKSSDIDTMQHFAVATSLYSSVLWRIATVLAPIVMTVAIALAVIGVVSSGLVIALFLGYLVVTVGQSKQITKFQQEVTAALQSLDKYVPLMQLIEQAEFQSPRLQELVKRLTYKKQVASKRVEKLATLLNNLDQRYNFVAAMLLNGLSLWDFRQVSGIGRWQRTSGKHLTDWLTVIAEVETLCSLAAFRYNHPHYAFPTLCTNGTSSFEAVAMGHPLIPASRMVTNDATLTARPAFMVVTGANMAGKSTYLRTIGINFVLASIGAPVCAESLCFTPAPLFTSLRTSDSLKDSESYFFAELKRLKQIIDRLKAGEPLFILLDEILKGTNSVDKQSGSLALVEQLVLLQAAGVIATHDLALGELANRFPSDITACCFEADITDNELTFSYKLRQGIAQNMNACFLMKKMGIIPSSVD